MNQIEGKKKKPIIGVVPLVDTEKESLWMLPGYMDGIMEAGGIPIMLPLTIEEDILMQIEKSCDGFLFTGGHDVSPELYGEKRLPSCGETSTERDKMEQILLKEALKGEKPVLGICRGIQFINAALGGTLYQDLPSQKPSPVEHHQKPPYDVPVHEVSLKKNTPLYELLGKESLQVNSYHHQAVKKLAEGLEAMAVSPDGLTEAFYLPQKKFVWGVQWHPEFAYKSSEDNRKIFEKFVASCAAL